MTTAQNTTTYTVTMRQNSQTLATIAVSNGGWPLDKDLALALAAGHTPDGWTVDPAAEYCAGAWVVAITRD